MAQLVLREGSGDFGTGFCQWLSIAIFITYMEARTLTRYSGGYTRIPYDPIGINLFFQPNQMKFHNVLYKDLNVDLKFSYLKGPILKK